jgi:hypothetical protein
MSVSTGLNHRQFLELEQATTHHATTEQHATAGKNNLNIRPNHVLASIGLIPLWGQSLYTQSIFIEVKYDYIIISLDSISDSATQEIERHSWCCSTGINFLHNIEIILVNLILH